MPRGSPVFVMWVYEKSYAVRFYLSFKGFYDTVMNMAKLTPKLFTKGKTLARYSVHPIKEADYHVFEEGGETILHIRTYSSAERKKEGNACQHIQIDREMAQVLVQIMKDAKLID